MKAFRCGDFDFPMPRRHRFPLAKYVRLREKVATAGHLDIELFESPSVSRAELEFTHEPTYIDRIIRGDMTSEEQRLLVFPWSTALIERALRSAGGTLAACRASIRAHVAVNLAEGTHPAKVNAATGYCLFNDAAIAARVMAERDVLERTLIVDADGHQGDGTAEILQPFPALYSFSIHAAGNYPRRKASSNLDIAVADGVGNEGYLRHFRDGLERAFLTSRPRLVIYLAGADPYIDDRFRRLNLSKEGLKQRKRQTNP